MATHEEELLLASIHATAPSPAFVSHKSEGNASFRAGDYASAIRHYTAAEQADPLSPVPPANRAMAHLKLRQWPAAKADAAVALELHDALPPPRRSPALRLKILLRSAAANDHAGNLAQAAAYYRHVLAVDPRNADARARLAELAERAPEAVAVAAAPRTDAPPAITLLSSSAAVPNGARPAALRPPAAAAAAPAPQTAPVQPLHRLPSPARAALVARWTRTPPASPFEFERAWNALPGDDRARAAFLLDTVGTQRLADGLLGETVTPLLLTQIVHALTAVAPADARRVADMLLALTEVARFDLLVMFWDTAEKRHVLDLLQMLEERGTPREQVAALRERYS